MVRSVYLRATVDELRGFALVGSGRPGFNFR